MVKKIHNLDRSVIASSSGLQDGLLRRTKLVSAYNVATGEAMPAELSANARKALEIDRR